MHTVHYMRNESGSLDTTLYKQFRAGGKIKNIREDVLIFESFNDGVLHFNTTRVVRKNPTDPFDVTEAEIEAREQVFEMQQFLKENIPGFENCRVLSTASGVAAADKADSFAENNDTKCKLIVTCTTSMRSRIGQFQ